MPMPDTGGREDRIAGSQDVDCPTALLHELTSTALARGERLEELSVSQPSLEDVYLELTQKPEGAIA